MKPPRPSQRWTPQRHWPHLPRLTNSKRSAGVALRVYLNVGAVEQGPPELRGRTVFCLYPHQTAYVVPAGAVTVQQGEIELELTNRACQRFTSGAVLYTAGFSLRAIRNVAGVPALMSFLSRRAKGGST